MTYALSKNGPKRSLCLPLGLGHGGAAVGTTERYATVRFALVLIDSPSWRPGRVSARRTTVGRRDTMSSLRDVIDATLAWSAKTKFGP